MGFFSDELPLPRADVLLLIVSFATGIIDTYTFAKLGVFVANMTGNSIFLGLAISGYHDPTIHADRSVTSLCVFWAGSFITGQIGHRVGSKRRWWLLTAFTSQALLIFLASILLYTKVLSDTDQTNLAVISLLAFAFGSQAAAGRPLGVAPITTVVVTSAMVDLFADKKLFVRLQDNAPRNQRVAFLLTFFVGGIVGGVTLVHSSPSFTVLLAGIVKTIAPVLLLLVKAKTDDMKVPLTAVEAGLPVQPADSASRRGGDDVVERGAASGPRAAAVGLAPDHPNSRESSGEDHAHTSRAT